MDSLTHTVIGACLGDLIAGKKLGKKAMLFGAIANNLPDIDVIVNLWAGETETLLIHRGITHSILVNLILTFVFAYFSNRYYKRFQLGINKWLILWGSGLFLHIFIDAFTVYGTGWFEPFSKYRVSFNTIFILDPIFTLPVLIGAIALLLLEKKSPRRLKWAKISLVTSLVYLFAITINKLRVNTMIEKSISIQHIEANDYMSTPTPLNNFLWYIMIKEDTTFKIGYYSIFDKSKTIDYQTVRQNDYLLSYGCQPEDVDNLRRFSQNYYTAHIENDTIVFSDMRFGQTGGWYNSKAAFVFNFKMAQNCSNKTALQKGRFEAFNSETTIQLFKRMKGK
jgi:inner membrane protein